MPLFMRGLGVLHRLGGLTTFAEGGTEGRFCYFGMGTSRQKQDRRQGNFRDTHITHCEARTLLTITLVLRHSWTENEGSIECESHAKRDLYGNNTNGV